VEARQVLEEMIAFDTSHGNETKLLEAIAARYREAGVSVQILESSPGRGNLIARLSGSGKKKPLLLIAHVDVVPVEGQPWTVPPFKATEKDGFLWGRGVNDDKGMGAAIVATTLEMARSHTPLSRDVIVALTAGEETGGFAGARWLTEKHKDLIDAEIALNEGGAPFLTDDFSKVLWVNLGVSEKVFASFKMIARGKGGHSSLPPVTGDPVVLLARALVKVGEIRFPARVLPEAKALFASEALTASPPLRAALEHAVATAPVLTAADDAVLVKEPHFNAEVRTTCVTTMLQAAPQDNVLPTTAEATINCRILPGDARAQIQAALAKTMGDDPNMTLSAEPDFGHADSSPYEGEVVAAVKSAAGKAFPGAIVQPSMSTGATDSRALRSIGIHAYGVSPSIITRAETNAAHGAHGPDERRNLRWMTPMNEYFRDVVRALVL
jgi:acetylornithine deacetylase/succinyl-diaminopimelate desuccinylase-like protein